MAPWWLRDRTDEKPRKEAPENQSGGTSDASDDSTESSAEDTAGESAEASADDASEAAPTRTKTRTSSRTRRGGRSRRGGRPEDESQDATASPKGSAKTTDDERETKEEKAERPKKTREKTRERTEPEADAEPKGEGGSQDDDEDRPSVALLIDLDTLVERSRAAGEGNPDLPRLLADLRTEGDAVVRKVYADWQRHRRVAHIFDEAGFERVEVASGAACLAKITADCIDLVHDEDLDAYVLVPGGKEVAPLVTELRERDQEVVDRSVDELDTGEPKGGRSKGAGKGKGGQRSPGGQKSSGGKGSDPRGGGQRGGGGGRSDADLEERREEAYDLLIEALEEIDADQDVLWASVIKQAMQNIDSSFREKKYGFGSFSELLEAAQEDGWVDLKKDEDSGSYVVTVYYV